MDQNRNQDRDFLEAGSAGLGYRLAAPALRARQRQSLNQAVLDYANPNWENGPRVPDLGELSQDRWHASEEAGNSLSVLMGQVKDLPWAEYLGSAKRASVIGAMGAVGFAAVLYQALPGPPVQHHAAAKPKPVEIADVVPQPAQASEPPPQTSGAAPQAGQMPEQTFHETATENGTTPAAAGFAEPGCCSAADG